MSRKVEVVIVDRQIPGAPLPPNTTGSTTCDRCAHKVLLIGRESAKVAAGTWTPVCAECSEELAAEQPEAFSPENYVGNSQDPRVE